MIWPQYYEYGSYQPPPARRDGFYGTWVVQPSILSQVTNLQSDVFNALRDPDQGMDVEHRSVGVDSVISLERVV